MLILILIKLLLIMDLNFRLSCLKYSMRMYLKQLWSKEGLNYFNCSQYLLYLSSRAMQLLSWFSVLSYLSDLLINYYLQELLSMCCYLQLELYLMNFKRYHYYLVQLLWWVQYYQSMQLWLWVQSRAKSNFMIKYLLWCCQQLQFMDLFTMLSCWRLVCKLQPSKDQLS